MVNIRISGQKDFPCPVSWTVEKAEERIRSMFGLVNGGILKNGEATDPAETITNDGDYEFVNAQPQPGNSTLSNKFIL
jgi:hypothetical protein